EAVGKISNKIKTMRKKWKYDEIGITDIEAGKNDLNMNNYSVQKYRERNGMPDAFKSDGPTVYHGRVTKNDVQIFGTHFDGQQGLPNGSTPTTIPRDRVPQRVIIDTGTMEWVAPDYTTKRPWVYSTKKWDTGDVILFTLR
ncbi:hypothetical protein, partial [Streptomyces sp. ADI96-02]|uniref:hypothetical protein n=1 Tax=Streptomyces sp. ADI96-02 TaxID=1522760 RepID=UPI0019CF9268